MRRRSKQRVFRKSVPHQLGAAMDDKITVRLPSELRQAIERYRNAQQGSFKSTQAVCRHIIEEWLSEQGYFEDKQTESRVPRESSRSVP